MPPHHRCFVDPGAHTHDPAAIAAVAAPAIVGSIRAEGSRVTADKGKGREIEVGERELGSTERARSPRTNSTAPASADAERDDDGRAGGSEPALIDLDSSGSGRHTPERPSFTPPPPIWSPTATSTTPPRSVGGSPLHSPNLGTNAVPRFVDEMDSRDRTISSGEPHVLCEWPWRVPG